MEQGHINVDELDPYSPDLTQEQILAIVERAKNDAFYYLTKVIRPTMRFSPNPSVKIINMQEEIIDGIRITRSVSSFSFEDGKELTVTELFRPQPEKQKRMDSILSFYKNAV